MGIDFLGHEFDSSKCMACEISLGNYTPPGDGIIFLDDYFFVHQDPYVPIPGFFIISPNRHIYSIDEMTLSEQCDLGRIIATTEKVIRFLTKVEHITVIQEEKIHEGHLHIWVFPWHQFLLEKFNYTLNNIRTITEYYKSVRNYCNETIETAKKAKEFFKSNKTINFTYNFHNQYLCDEDFSNKDLSWADFSGAVLKRCNFDNCDLSHVNFDNADLYRASFNNSVLYSTTYRNADLTRADFTDAQMYGIKIFGADLSHTIFDETIKEEREKDFTKAEDVYNTIKRAYSENGNKELASKYYYKQCVAKRKNQKGIQRFLSWLIADKLIGYGERLSRCLVISSIIIILFGILYFIRMGYSDLVLSLFCSLALFFGFDPVGKCDNIVDMNIFYMVERLIGYFFIVIAVIGMTRKIVRD